jgi:transcription-repair coupling factor (superfamily II helicase)
VLELRQKLDLAAEQRRLAASGYRNVPQVLEPGDFAVRGALLDIFPMGSPEPYRVELFDDEIDSIRTFDPETQRSEHKVDAVRLLPAREFPLTEESAKAFRNTLRERFPIDVRRCPLYQDIKEGGAPAGIEYYLPLFFERTETLFDYLPGSTLFVLADGALESAETFWTQTAQRWEQRAHDVERPVLPPAELYLPPQQVRERLNDALRVDVIAKGANEHALDLGTQPAPSLPLSRKGEENGEALRRFIAAYPGRVLIAVDSAGRREALIEQLAAAQLRPLPYTDWAAFTRDGNRFGIVVAPLESGFALTEPALTVLTERELYGERAQQTRRRKRAARDPEAVLRDLSELSIGSPIVHVDHGVGRYQGLIKLDVGGRAQFGEEPAEFLSIEYAKGDKLYVPVAQLHLVSRYSGTAPELAPLHALGGDAWERAKKKAADKVRDAAAELLAIYAQREARQGVALPIDRDMAEQFGAAFPFEETPDQATAIAAVIEDLAAGKPMDRVVCGDVGFGKTEVALRAAFVAATAGKQVAVLAPTTLLAQQHFQNFRDRFADWPIRVEVLSRFKSPKEIRSALDKLAAGQIDVMIGTHKLVQPDVKFKDLGLVIIDEEQRFGVRQKEALKKLRAEVDVLTLTATPIPRTLNMAMSGLRDLSIIATPPAHRLAVQTFIGPYDAATIREAMQREHARGGQVYFLHNDVETIEKPRANCRNSCPTRASASRTARCRTANSSRSCSTSTASVSTCWSRRRSSNRASTCRAPTRSSSTAPIVSASRSCTSCAAASAVLTIAPMRTSWCLKAARSPPMRKSASRRSPRSTNSAPVSRSPRTTWKSAAPANCSARNSPARSRKSASRSTPKCSTAPCARSSRARCLTSNSPAKPKRKSCSTSRR